MKLCEICGKQDYKCVNTKEFGLLCNKHYQQIKKYGRIFERTLHDPNEIITYDEYAEIILYNIKGEEVSRTIIDVEDIDKIKQYKWYLQNNGYASTGGGKNRILLHRLLLDAPPELKVDHRDGNRLNNLKTNIRICTQQQNTRNQGIKSTNKSGVTGVCWDINNNKWYAYIGVDSRNIFLGRFDDFDEAVKVRKDAEKTYFEGFKEH